MAENSEETKNDFDDQQIAELNRILDKNYVSTIEQVQKSLETGSVPEKAEPELSMDEIYSVLEEVAAVTNRHLETNRINIKKIKAKAEEAVDFSKILDGKISIQTKKTKNKETTMQSYQKLVGFFDQ
ncbi:hypothetical protein ECANGB1_1096 [Enterospora canceri]|uniref:Uncharacterized protein n=1 Tax=Enterospora canceri TaxID=1081671 RepID=A0A1Y1S7N0_9MICR|nr:hypothetical protein ECANGB1_1096 [Enterospora canceri]